MSKPAFIALAMVAITASPVQAATVGTCLTVIRVSPLDVLFIRARPDHRSAKVGAIAPDSDSPIVITGACTPPGASPRRLWCPVKYYVTKDETRSGYVKMYFTREVPCPPSLDFYRQ